MMMEICNDFRAEVDYLYRVFRQLPEDLWSQETGFMRWTPWDVIAHLHYFDLASMKSAESRKAFEQEVNQLSTLSEQGKNLQKIAHDRFQTIGYSQLLDDWFGTADTLVDRFIGLDPSSRLPWFGPDMGARMFLTARLMETWSHSQAIFDLAGLDRTHTDRVRHIATIGVKTFGWTFVNRNQEPPGLPPKVRLTGPSGVEWTWNEDNATDCVCGNAVEFCFVVTQSRNIADTDLEVEGLIAKQWMAMAQCFGGPPIDPPAPGTRLK